jgi:NADH-quinone oxidoreductase subunit J
MSFEKLFVLLPRKICGLRLTNNNMETTISQIIFYVLSGVMLAAAVFAVTAKKMLRAATCLLVVLIGTAGLYLLLNYHFLAAVQLSVYAGGILVLFIFAILLTRPRGDEPEPHSKRKIVAGASAALLGVVVVGYMLLKTKFLYNNSVITSDHEINMADIGTSLMGTAKYQYLLAFEMLSILLLVCIVGGVLIARKRT